MKKEIKTKEEMFKYLKSLGFVLSSPSCTKKKPYIEHWVIEAGDIPSYYLEKSDVLGPLIDRFVEVNILLAGVEGL